MDALDATLADIGECRRRLDALPPTPDVGSLAREGRALSEGARRLAGDLAAFDADARPAPVEEPRALAAELEDARAALAALAALVDCDRRLRRSAEAEAAGDAAGASEELAAVDALLAAPAAAALRMRAALRGELERRRARVSRRLDELWDAAVGCEETRDEGGATTVVVRVDALPEALVAGDGYRARLERLAAFVHERALLPIVRGRETSARADGPRLEVVVAGEARRGDDDDGDGCSRALDRAELVFGFLHERLGGEAAAAVVGEAIGRRFAAALVDECLDRTAPDRVGEATARVDAFQRFLCSRGFLRGDDLPALRRRDADALFADKTCRRFLESARAAAARDLSDAMSVGCEADEAESEAEGELLRGFFGASPFRFPRCAVSRSARELVDLAALMREQAVEASDLCARRLYCAARDAFELYAAVAPLHHKRAMDSSPQRVALFHNNCMYLAHRLLALGPEWQKSLEGRRPPYAISFCDLVKEFRDLGAHALLACARRQRELMLDALRSSDLHYLATKDALSESAEKAVRRCVRQLRALRTAWSGTLPAEAYARLIAALADALVEELVSKVLSQEDVAAEVASQLAELYGAALPQIYDDESAAEESVRSRGRLRGLVSVLGGSLATVEEGWRDGAGPLAAHFEPDELKRLVRALFQNTTFRAALLSKIK